MNAALGLISKPEGNSEHFSSAPDATIILVRAKAISFIQTFRFFCLVGGWISFSFDWRIDPMASTVKT